MQSVMCWIIFTKIGMNEHGIDCEFVKVW